MKTKKRIICAALSSVFICAAASAAGQNGKVTLSGKSEKNNEIVSVQIYEPGKDFSDLEKTDKNKYLDVIVYQNTTLSDENGEYIFEAEMGDRSSGVYRAFVSIDGAVEEKEVRYINVDECKSAISLLNEAATDATEIQVQSVLKSNREALGLWTPFFDDIDSLKAAERIFKVLQSEKLIAENTQDAIALVNKAVLLEALSEGIVDNILVLTDEIDLSKTSIGEWYNKDFATDKVGKNCTDRMEKQTVTMDNFEAKLAETFVLAVIEDPDGFGNVKTLLNAFSASIGISKNEDDDVYRSLVGQNFGSFSELKTEFNKLLKNDSAPSLGGGGGRRDSSVSLGGNIGIVESPKEIPFTVFEDLSNVPWAEEAIVSLAEKGIINGKTKTTFCPQDFITREEFAKLLVGAFAADAEPSDKRFTDVLPNEWYAPFVAKAVGAGISKGMDENNFGIGRTITRQDMAVMAYNAVKIAQAEINFKFEDDAEIADYAREAVYALYSSEVISGMDENRFAPTEYATRAQAAKILYSLMQQ